MARARINVENGTVKVKSQWDQAVHHYAECVSNNTVHVQEPAPLLSLSPGNQAEHPITVLSTAPTPETTGVQRHSYRLHSMEDPTTPTPAFPMTRAPPQPHEAPKAKGKAVTKHKGKAAAKPKASTVSSAVTRVRKKPASSSSTQEPLSYLSLYADEEDETDAENEDERSFVIPKRARSPSLTIISGPITIEKPAPQPENVIVICDSSDDEEPSTPTAHSDKRPHKTFKKLNIFTAGDVEQALKKLEGPAATSSKRALDNKCASGDAQQPSKKLRALTPREIKRTMEEQLAAMLQHTNASQTSGSQDGKLDPTPRSASQTPMDAKDLNIQPDNNMDTEPDEKLDGRHSDDEYHFSDLDEVELDRVMANPMVPSPSKFRAMGKFRRMELKK